MGQAKKRRKNKRATPDWNRLQTLTRSLLWSLSELRWRSLERKKLDFLSFMKTFHLSYKMPGIGPQGIGPWPPPGTPDGTQLNLSQHGRLVPWFSSFHKGWLNHSLADPSPRNNLVWETLLGDNRSPWHLGLLGHTNWNRCLWWLLYTFLKERILACYVPFLLTAH